MTRAISVLTLLTVATVPGIASAAQQTIYSFTNGTDGSHPRSALIMDAAGALYGTTFGGGNTSVCFRTPGCGVVFKLVPPATGQSAATETPIYALNGTSDGVGPVGGLLMDSAGALYGTSSQGGAGGYGVVFKLSPPASGTGAWTSTDLYSFTGGKDGGSPLATLAADSTGSLYGTTQLGGANGDGVVFRLTPKAGGKRYSQTVLHSFTGSRDGASPIAGLALNSTGTLYGTTPNGGAHGFGVAFALTPPPAGKSHWTETVLHAFTSGNDGSYPMGSLLPAADGGLYGTTSNMGTNAAGIGTVFELIPPAAGKTHWKKKVLWDFASFDSTAGNPVGPLTMDQAGALYGTSVNGGAGQMGVLYKLTPPATKNGAWTESEPDSFYGNGSDGAQPMGGAVVAPDGTLFGTTYVGGKYRYGAVFAVTQ